MRMDYGGFFGPLNGLMGFHSKEHSGTFICNVSTQEVSPLIKSTSSGNVEDKETKTERTPHYEIGFDPVTKSHKVISIWRIYDSNTSRYDCLCEVLTVGDNKWRKIALLPFDLDCEQFERKHTVYLNGHIYYCTSTFMKAGEPGNDKIVAFDVGAENFSVITVPNFILDQPRLVNRDGTSSNHLIELEGCLALISNMSDYTAKLCVFDDVHGNSKEKNTRTSGSSHQNWTEVTISLLWSARRDIGFHSVVGTDEIVIKSYDLYYNLFQLHLYNWKTRSCREIEISGFQNYASISRISTLVESLVRVQ